MRGTFVLSVLLFVGFMAWRLTERLSADALGLAAGVFLGVLAGIPVALLVLAATRRRPQEDEEGDDDMHPSRRGNPYAMQPAQPPVIILSGYPQAGQQQSPYGDNFPAGRMLPAESDIVDARRFHVVGEEEEIVEEW